MSEKLSIMLFDPMEAHYQKRIGYLSLRMNTKVILLAHISIWLPVMGMIQMVTALT